jgi:hypothetical protein
VFFSFLAIFLEIFVLKYYFANLPDFCNNLQTTNPSIHPSTPTPTKNAFAFVGFGGHSEPATHQCTMKDEW